MGTEPESAQGLETKPVDRAGSSKSVAEMARAHEPALSVKTMVLSCSGAEAGFKAAIELGRSLAQRGRAIVVAADSDDRSYDALVSSEQGARPSGLCDLIAEAATFAETIHRDVGSRLHIIPGGRATDLADYDIEPILDALAQTYDFVTLVTASRERAMGLAPLFDLILIKGEDHEADAARAETLRAGAADVFILENETSPANLFAA